MQKTRFKAVKSIKNYPLKPYCISDGIHMGGSPLFHQSAPPYAYGGRDQKKALEMPKKKH